MEKSEQSIESIWKEGFLKEDALVAPKLNDLYNRKSIHLVDKYKRMFKTNMVGIFIGSVVILIALSLLGIPYAGAAMFFILNAMVIVDKGLLNELDKLDNSQTSYQYLKMLDRWMEHKSKANINMARVFYPYAFVVMMLGMYFLPVRGEGLGEQILQELLTSFPNISLVFGLPVIMLVALITIAGILAFIAKRIYLWDLQLVYGDILQKLKNLLADMEELRA